ncbi:HepT-like ribonuclease domain-containing protein [Nitrospira sp. Kam-Ns4a]
MHCVGMRPARNGARVEAMSRVARFRNLLVHLYWNVEDREVYRVICASRGF